MSNIKKRLISALCTFVVGASSDLVALPKFNYLAYVNSTDKLLSRKSSGGMIETVVKNLSPSAVGFLGAALVGDTVVLKYLEWLGKQYVVTHLCAGNSEIYRVLWKKFNLLQKGNELREVSKKVTAIGSGLNKIKDYFMGGRTNEGFFSSPDENINNLDNLKADGGVVAALCHLLSIAYVDKTDLRDDDIFDRVVGLSKRVFVPLSTPRADYSFESDKKKYKYAVDDEGEMKTGNDIRNFIFSGDGEDSRWRVEGWFHGYNKPVKYPFNVVMIKEYLSRKFNVKAASDPNDKESVYMRDFLDKFDKLRGKEVVIDEKNSFQCVRSEQVLHLFVEAKVGEETGTLNVDYNIPDGKGNVDIGKLFSIGFRKTDS